MSLLMETVSLAPSSGEDFKAESMEVIKLLKPFFIEDRPTLKLLGMNGVTVSLRGIVSGMQETGAENVFRFLKNANLCLKMRRSWKLYLCDARKWIFEMNFKVQHLIKSKNVKISNTLCE